MLGYAIVLSVFFPALSIVYIAVFVVDGLKETKSQLSTAIHTYPCGSSDGSYVTEYALLCV